MHSLGMCDRWIGHVSEGEVVREMGCSHSAATERLCVVDGPGMMWKHTASFVWLLAVAAACSLVSPVTPSEDQVASADYGPEPEGDALEDAIRFAVRGVHQFRGVELAALHVEHDAPEMAWVGQRNYRTKQPEFLFGWRVNAVIASPAYTLRRSFLFAKRPHGFGAVAWGDEDIGWFFSPRLDELNRELASRGPGVEVVEAAEFGPQPRGFESALSVAIKRQLKDPASARIRFAKAARAWGRSVDREGTLFGWRVTAFVNAKNSYGGYVGEKPYSFMFRDGEMVSATPLGLGFELPAHAAPIR